MSYNIANLLSSLTCSRPVNPILQYKPEYIIKNAPSFKKKVYHLENKLSRINFQNIQSLLNYLYLWDPSTGRHSVKVANLCFSFASAIDLPSNDIRCLYFASLLHDIGKTSIPKHILIKPTKLILEEYEIIKQHSSIGADIVRKIDDICHLKDIIRHHHERYDGTGYPDGLVGEKIPLLSRIMALCDTYEAMTGQRHYRYSVPAIIALDEIYRCCNTQFDPDLADSFIKWMKQNKNNTLV